MKLRHIARVAPTNDRVCFDAYDVHRRFVLSRLDEDALFGVGAIAAGELLAREVERQIEPLPEDVRTKAYTLIDKCVEKKREDADSVFAIILYTYIYIHTYKLVEKSHEEADSACAVILCRYPYLLWLTSGLKRKMKMQIQPLP